MHTTSRTYRPTPLDAEHTRTTADPKPGDRLVAVGSTYASGGEVLWVLPAPRSPHQREIAVRNLLGGTDTWRVGYAVELVYVTTEQQAAHAAARAAAAAAVDMDAVRARVAARRAR